MSGFFKTGRGTPSSWGRHVARRTRGDALWAYTASDPRTSKEKQRKANRRARKARRRSR